MTGVLVATHEPGSPEWLALRRSGITASEIAAVMGISPWQSPFSLFWSKVNDWHAQGTDEMDAGNRLEPVIADWFADRHPEVRVTPTGTWRNSERPWQIANPDRLLLFPEGFRCAALLECKAVFSWDDWGDEGTEDVPVHYRAQCLWQMDAVGVDIVFIAAFSGLQFRQFEIRRDDTDLKVMRDAAQAFLRRIALGDEPDIDEHSATLRTLKALHPSIEDRDQEIPAEVADGYRAARAALAVAQSEADGWESRLRAAMGDARRAVCAGSFVASRSMFDVDENIRAAYSVDRLNPARSK